MGLFQGTPSSKRKCHRQRHKIADGAPNRSHNTSRNHNLYHKPYRQPRPSLGKSQTNTLSTT